MQLRTVTCLIILILVVFIGGCSQQQQQLQTDVPVKESRWLVVSDDAAMTISLDKQSITRNTEAGSNISSDSTKYKLIRRDVITCWIKVEPKGEYKQKLIEGVTKKHPKVAITNITHGMENISFDLLTREYMSVEEIAFDGQREIVRDKVSDKWKKIVPGDDFYEVIFEAAKKQSGVK